MKRLHALSNVSSVADPFFVRLLAGITEHSSFELSALRRDLVPPMLGLGSHLADVGWVCGLLHVDEQAHGGWPYQALAAPVMAPRRYVRQPVYFGDVVVAEDSNAHSLSDALTAQFVMNQPESLSGHVMVTNELRSGRFGDAELSDVLLSGSHLTSLRYVAAEPTAFACIDSTVVDMLRSRSHPLLNEVRVVESIGPYPAPPIVMSSGLPLEVRWELLRGIKAFVASPAGRKLLYSWNVSDIVQVDDSAYDVLRSVTA